MHRIAKSLSEYSLAKHWINPDDQEWCIYAIETKLLSIVFFFAMAVLALILNAIPQTSIFTLTFYNLRRRIGGYHAPHAWVCLLISICVTFCITHLIGPALEQIPYGTVIAIDILALTTAMVKKPVYPPQTQFNNAVVAANNRRKNVILFIIAIVQFVCFRFYPYVLVYSFLAVLTGLISVYIELFRQMIMEGYDEKVRIS